MLGLSNLFRKLVAKVKPGAMLERTQIYVDTSYLLASFYNSWEIGARAQLEIDLPEVVRVLGSMVQNQLHQPVHRQYWYDGIPETGPHRYQRALRTCDGVQLRAGTLIEWGERRTQKAVDTRLVADMVLSSVRREVTDIVLVSGDADMIPGVQEAVNHGIRVHLYGFGWDSMSSALRHACDSTVILDPREDFEDCMQLQVLEGPLPPSVRLHDDDACPDDSPCDAEEKAAETCSEIVSAELATTVECHEQSKAQSSSPVRRIRPGEPAFCDDDHEMEPPRPSPNPRRAQSEPQSNTESEEQPQLQQAEQSSISTIEVSSTAIEEVTKDGHSYQQTDRISVTTTTNGTARATNPGADQNLAQSATSRPSPADAPAKRPAPNPSMMAPRRKLRSRYVPLPNEVWTSAGFLTPFDVGQQYAIWWYENAATAEQRDSAHLLSGGGLPPEIDRPLLQFACETLHEYTLTETQRVNLRDGFHSGIRGILVNNQFD